MSTQARVPSFAVASNVSLGFWSWMQSEKLLETKVQGSSGFGFAQAF